MNKWFWQYPFWLNSQQVQNTIKLLRKLVTKGLFKPIFDLETIRGATYFQPNV